MNKIFILCFSILILIFSIPEVYSQKKKRERSTIERSPKQEIVYDNNDYFPTISSVQFYPKGKENGLPILSLNSDEQLHLSFEDLRGDIRDLYFSIEYCDADWQPSRVSKLDYVDGFNEDRIEDYQASKSTYQPFTYYSLSFPTEYTKPKLAGNYLLKIYEDADKNRLLLTRRFYVLKNIIGINCEITPSNKVIKRNSHQKVNLTLSTSALTINNPQRDLHILVKQNKRADSEMIADRPSFIGPSEIKYHDMETLDFKGNNEFRYVDLRSFKLPSERMKTIGLDSITNIVLFTDSDHTGSTYASTYDENGNFFIRNLDQPDDNLEGDYANVTFSLRTGKNIEDDIYITGGFNDFRPTEEHKLHYDHLTDTWKVTVRLKQGLYDYEYITKNDEGKIETDIFSDSFYQTGNDYQVLVYSRRPGTYWDELVGYFDKNINKR